MVGGKAFNLATIGRNLQPSIPDGFVITTNAFQYFLEFNNLRKTIDKKLLELDIRSPASLEAVSSELTRLIEDAPTPPDIAEAVKHAFDKLKVDKGRESIVAVRSSAVGEDTRSSFAGQYQTILNVNADQILNAYKAVIASKYTSRALYYRISYGLSDTEIPMSVLIVEIIPARSSGVVYTDGLGVRPTPCDFYPASSNFYLPPFNSGIKYPALPPPSPPAHLCRSVSRSTH